MPAGTSFLLADQMVRVDIELVAHVLVNFPVRKQRVSTVERMGLSESLGVVQSNIDAKVPQIRALVALGNMQLIAVRHPLPVQPGLIVEPYGIDNQSVAVPLGYRVPHPQRVQILCMQI